MNINKVAQAIRKDAGIDIPDLEQSLHEMKARKVGKRYTPEQLLVRSVRQHTGLSQAEFAKVIKTPVATLRDWEQGRFTPPGSALCLLRIIEKHPDLIQELAECA